MQSPAILEQPTPPPDSSPGMPEASPTSNPRFASAVVFIVSLAILGVAFALTPSDRGVGTHKAMGLPACGMLETTGIPCATCGMTTSFSYTAHGQFLNAFTTQPAGAVFALLTAMACVLSGYALFTGMSLAPVGVALWRPRVFIIAAAVVLAAWVYKIYIITGWFGANS